MRGEVDRLTGLKVTPCQNAGLIHSHTAGVHSCSSRVAPDLFLLTVHLETLRSVLAILSHKMHAGWGTRADYPSG